MKPSGKLFFKAEDAARLAGYSVRHFERVLESMGQKPLMFGRRARFTRAQIEKVRAHRTAA